jgi:Predicted DNA binding protein
MLSLVTFKVRHDDWSQLTEIYQVKVTKRHTIIREGNIFDVVQLSGEELGGFLRNLRVHPRVREVRLLERSPTTAAVMLVAKLEGSITSVMVEQAYEFSESLKDGVEYWRAVLPRGRIGKLTETVSRMGLLSDLTIREFSYHRERNSLTEREREVLAVALSMGYFESPRQVTAFEVATSLGISKVSFTQHLRRIGKKLATKELGESAANLPGTT